MPFNSFEDYPMTWRPDRERLTRPLYQSIADLLERDILEGTLASHTKLPPQRELADFLDVNLSTVTRAYQICRRRGLLYATTGSGTFVAPQATVERVVLERSSGDEGIELSVIEPFPMLNDRVLRAASAVLARPGAEQLFAYSDPLGSPAQREVAAGWLAQEGVQAAAGEVIITTGTQSGIVAALIALFSAGDRIAVDPFTYPNFIELAKLLQLRPIPVPGDGAGMSPDALEELCRHQDIRGLYLMPSCNNPTTQRLSADRRAQLAGVMERHSLLLIEDDAYGFLDPDHTPPMAALQPQRTVYINGISTSLSGGLRVAFMTVPEPLRNKLVAGLYNTNLKTSSLNAEIAAELIRSGTALDMVRHKVELAVRRNRLYAQVFPEQPPGPPGFYRWLPLPEHLQRTEGAALEQAAREAGVRLFHSDRFAVTGGEGGAALRLSLSSVEQDATLLEGLRIVRRLLEQSNQAARETVFIV